MAHVLFVKQIKSSSKVTPKQMATLKALGLRGPNTEVVRQDLRAIRGMLNKVQHLIQASRLEEAEVKARSKKAQNKKGYRLEN